MPLQTASLRELLIQDEESFRHVGLYDQLKRILIRDEVKFRFPAPGSRSAAWDRVLFLNLTYWSADEPTDVLMDDTIEPDVVAHVAWHHLARRALTVSTREEISADALFLGESIASAFDLYLVGRLLGHAPDSNFLRTQVPAMADAAELAGMSADDFEAMLNDISNEPERAFEDLRQLLFDVCSDLIRAPGIDDAAKTLERHDQHRFAPLLHHYEISNWILYARAYAPEAHRFNARVREIDLTLRNAPVALDWLEKEWVEINSGFSA